MKGIPMISMNSSNASPPQLKRDDIAFFARFMDVLSWMATDPKGVRDRLAELATATVASQDAADAAKAERERLEAVQKAHEDTLSAARDAHDRRLAAQQAEFEEKCAARERSLAEAEAAQKVAADKLAAQTEATAKLKAELQSRIDRIRAAAA
jgi:hypothetical protein